jgi:hypothetical protein
VHRDYCQEVDRCLVRNVYMDTPALLQYSRDATHNLIVVLHDLTGRCVDGERVTDTERQKVREREGEGERERGGNRVGRE